VTNRTFLRGALGRASLARRALRADGGFMLIEVMISALLLGLVAAATVTGVDSINSNSANQRSHEEANLLAAQSQEQLRSDPIGLLEKLVRETNTYSTTLNATTYKVAQEATELNGSAKATTCSATSTAGTAAPNFRITSAVTWSDLLGGHPVSESSIVTPPTGSALQVNVVNGEPPTGGVSGVTAIVTYDSNETGAPVTLEGTTGAAGCVLFTGIRADTATASLQEKIGYVTPSGTLKPNPASVSIAPNLTTYHSFVYDAGGQIEAKYTYKGSAEYNGKAVTGNTFVAANPEMNTTPELELGSPAFAAPESTGEERYNAETGTYAQTALTATASKYPNGDLFPFPSKWSVYAGDCAQNNPALVVTKETVTPGSEIVTPGGRTVALVPEAYVNLKVYEGTKTSPKTPTQKFEAKITNLSCSKAPPASPNHAASVSYTHTQTTSGAELGAPFQPFGTLEICVKASATRHDLLTYQATTQSGAATSIYTEELSATEKTQAREEQEEESPARETRVKEEATEKSTKEKEASAKTTREAAELTARNAWKLEEKQGRISKTTRENDEKAQEATRKTDEKAEETAAAKRVKEETATTKTRETEEATRTTTIKEEEKEISERQFTAETVTSGKSC
jgi:Tfp pilus assembly protein PilV